MGHDEIGNLLKDGDAMIITQGKGNVGGIQFRDDDVFNYNEDKPINIKLKDYVR